MPMKGSKCLIIGIESIVKKEEFVILQFYIKQLWGLNKIEPMNNDDFIFYQTKWKKNNKC